MMIRIDGHKFSKFTGGLQRPFDQNFHHCMVITLGALMKEYSADLGYT